MPTRVAYLHAALILTAAVALSPVSAAAAAQRTFVASNGLDSNPCSVSAPCRSFGTAIANTLSGGELIVLDSAGYGPVTVTQTVSIVAPPGVYAGITVFLGNDGVTVNGSGIEVTLRGLTISGQGGGTGIKFVLGSRLNVENCLVTHMSLNALSIDGGTSSQIYVSDSTFRYSTANGIDIRTGIVTIDRVRLENNTGSGIFVGASSVTPVVVLVRDSVSSRNVNHGYTVNVGSPNIARLAVVRSAAHANGSFGAIAASTGGTAILSISGSEILENQQGGVVSTNAGATVTVSGSTISRNANYGLQLFGAAVLTTLQNNTIELNALGPANGTITTSSVQ